MRGHHAFLSQEKPDFKAEGVRGRPGTAIADTLPMKPDTHTLPLHRLPEKSAPPLDLLPGVKILDLTTSIAGPYAGQ